MNTADINNLEFSVGQQIDLYSEVGFHRELDDDVMNNVDDDFDYEMYGCDYAGDLVDFFNINESSEEVFSYQLIDIREALKQDMIDLQNLEENIFEDIGEKTPQRIAREMKHFLKFLNELSDKITGQIQSLVSLTGETAFDGC